MSKYYNSFGSLENIRRLGFVPHRIDLIDFTGKKQSNIILLPVNYKLEDCIDRLRSVFWGSVLSVSPILPNGKARNKPKDLPNKFHTEFIYMKLGEVVKLDFYFVENLNLLRVMTDEVMLKAGYERIGHNNKMVKQ